jgi:hypothetical protein
MKQRRPLAVFETEEFDQFIGEIDRPINYECALTILRHQPQGTKCFYDGESFDSKYEAYVYCYYKKIKCIPIERNKTEWLPYVDEAGKKRKWFFDFIIGGEPTEVKGYFRITDEMKQRQNPTVKFLTSVEINPMKKEVKKVFPDFESELILK